MYFIDDIDGNRAKYSHENPDCLGLFGYEKSHYFWIESKQPWDTGIFLLEKYVILEKICFKMHLSALKSDKSQFFAPHDEDEGVIIYYYEENGDGNGRF